MPRVPFTVPASRPDDLRAAALLAEPLIARTPAHHPLRQWKLAALEYAWFKEGRVSWPETLDAVLEKTRTIFSPAMRLCRLGWALERLRRHGTDLESELEALSDVDGFAHTEFVLFCAARLVDSGSDDVRLVRRRPHQKTPDIEMPRCHVAIECKARTIRRPDAPIADDFNNAQAKLAAHLPADDPKWKGVLAVDMGLVENTSFRGVGRPTGDPLNLIAEARRHFSGHPHVHAFILAAHTFEAVLTRLQVVPNNLQNVVYALGTASVASLDRAFGDLPPPPRPRKNTTGLQSLRIAPTHFVPHDSSHGRKKVI